MKTLNGDIIQQRKYTLGHTRLLLTLKNQAVARFSIKTSLQYEHWEIPFECHVEQQYADDLKILDDTEGIGTTTYVPDAVVSFVDFKRRFLDKKGYVEFDS